jgi:hypothetical protein
MTADVLELSAPVTAPKRWRVEMADKTTRTVEARGFRVEGCADIRSAGGMRRCLRTWSMAVDRGMLLSHVEQGTSARWGDAGNLSADARNIGADRIRSFSATLEVRSRDEGCDGPVRAAGTACR